MLVISSAYLGKLFLHFGPFRLRLRCSRVAEYIFTPTPLPVHFPLNDARFALCSYSNLLYFLRQWYSIRN